MPTRLLGKNRLAWQNNIIANEVEEDGAHRATQKFNTNRRDYP
jgi:hypothetical protein